MIDDFMCLLLVVAIVGTAWISIRSCADAVLHGERDWWIRALYLAQQRAEYREFCDGLEQKRKCDRIGV